MKRAVRALLLYVLCLAVAAPACLGFARLVATRGDLASSDPAPPSAAQEATLAEWGWTPADRLSVRTQSGFDLHRSLFYANTIVDDPQLSEEPWEIVIGSEYTAGWPLRCLEGTTWKRRETTVLRSVFQSAVETTVVLWPGLAVDALVIGTAWWLLALVALAITRRTLKRAGESGTFLLSAGTGRRRSERRATAEKRNVPSTAPSR